MRVARREFLHLLGAAGLSACGDKSPKPAPTEPTTRGPWWLRGNYAPVDELEATDLEVVGTLPETLSGLYVRNGPNPATGQSAHWFVGDGMLHGVRLEGGGASWYRARYVQTEALGTETDPDDVGPPSLTEHQANTSVIAHGDRLLALLEIGHPYALDPETLATTGIHDFGGALETPMTAHPKRDPVTGELLFFGYSVFEPFLTFHLADATGALVRSEAIEVPGPAMMHDFQITATRVVFLFLPVMFDIDLATEGDPMPFRWDPSVGARIGVMPRGGTSSDVEWFDVEPCYVFHTFNAYDDPQQPGTVVLEAIRYPEMWVTSADAFEASGAPYRWTLESGKGAKGTALDDAWAEFPRVDPRRQGRPHRYGYAVSATPPADSKAAPEPTTLVRFDFQTGTIERHATPGGMRIGEAVFVPASEEADEGDGYLLTYGYDAEANVSELLVLDASQLGEAPVARIRLPRRVPYGFHGNWVPLG